MKVIKKILGNTVLAVFAIIAIIVLISSTYIVKVNTESIVFRLGRVQSTSNAPGIHFHIPFIESTTSIYTGNILYDIPVSDVITSDKKSMIADDYVIWHVSDPVKYYQTLGAIRGRAEERIEAAAYNATKNTISSMAQEDIIAARGSTLTDVITKEANSDIGDYGVVIDLCEIKELDLPDDNKAAVYERMISERNNIAAAYLAQGNSDAQKTKNDTDQKVSIMTAEANRDAEKIIAEGEAEYMRILAEAYNDESKAEFYNFMRGLDSLNAMVGDNKTLILDKNSEYARLIYGED